MIQTLLFFIDIQIYPKILVKVFSWNLFKFVLDLFACYTCCVLYRHTLYLGALIVCMMHGIYKGELSLFLAPF